MIPSVEHIQKCRVNVTSVDGDQHPADLLVCPACRCEEWVLYMLEGQDHLHVQCSRCGVSYCAKGGCS